MSTIKDVAKEAGVAVGTVSKVINNIPVKQKTKEVVEAAIKKLKYEPNIYARGLKINRTNTIALILPTVWNPFFGELAYNVEKNLREIGMKMILCNSEGNYKNELEYTTMVKQNKVDGIIAITYSDINKHLDINIPIVSIDRYFSENITYITSDNLAGGALAAKKLIENGCKSIAYIGRGSKIDNATRNRKKGFENYCIDNNIFYNICDSLESSEEFEVRLNKFLNENFKDKIKFDGIFTITDQYAIDIIDRLKKINIRVPEDVKVIGYDGSKSSINDKIKISTIRQPIELIAKEAVDCIIKLIENKEVEKEIILPVKYIKGYTTKV